MKQQSKNLYGKLVDFKRFGIVLLAVGAFFFLGVIIPMDNKTPMELNIMILSSMVFLTASLFFFIQSKECQAKLLEMEDGDEFNHK